jgi:hypothetical protein
MCQYKWYLGYIKLLTPKKPQAALEDGTIFHEALDAFYTGASIKDISKQINNDYRDLLKNARVSVDAKGIADYEKRKMIIQSMVYSYSQFYASDFENWVEIAPEEEFRIPLADDVFLMGKRDGNIIAKDGKRYIVEHKSTSMLAATYISQLEMSLQMQVYLLADYLENGNDRAEALIINAALKSKLKLKKTETTEEYIKRVVEAYKDDPQKHFFREELRIPIKTLKKIKNDVIKVVRHMRRAAADPKNEVTRDEGSCYKYGPCEFLPICKSRSLKGPHMNAYFTRASKHQELDEESQK